MDRIKFKVNGEEHSVGGEVSSDVMLLDYIRSYLELRGTKYNCREGGCGACIVSAATSPGETPKAVNSCLVSITSCQDWEITTIEKVGNRGDGYHPIQKTIAENNGTQCGYCTPGWVMAMYSLAQNKKDLTKLEIEKSFGSNICRCTGYRPILDGLKKFAVDADDNKIADIEDLYICKKSNKPCTKTCGEEDWCVISGKSGVMDDDVIKIELKDNKKWYKVTEISQIFDILSSEGEDSYMLVAGNTAKGAFPIDEYPSCLIDITGISELKGYQIDQNLNIGANTTLTETMEIFEIVSDEEYFSYLKKLHDHLQLVAHIPVRNLGTIAGNLMTKHKHRSFASDVFLLLETVDAYVTIVDSQGSRESMNILDFLATDMTGKILYNIMLPPLNDDEYKLATFKIMPRSQNAHAIVNAGFQYKVKSDNTVEDARIVFGGISSTFTRAFETEEYLVGKKLFENDTLQGAIKKLDQEVVAVENLPEPSPEYRKQLAIALFYKGLLTLCPEDKIKAKYRSGAKKLHESRPVSQGRQEFSTDPKLYPLNEPIMKVEAMIQCAGEAKYTDDLPSLPYELYSALVLSTVGQGEIESIDPSEALAIPGVEAFYSAKDIPGENSFQLLGEIVFVKGEEVFCSKEIKYYNQPLGIIVAETTALAERAAKKVKVTYTNVRKPLIDIKEAKEDKSRYNLFLPLPNIGRGLLNHKEFKSNYTIYGQYHFPMETIVSISRPSEDGLAVYSSSQWMDAVQYTTAKALNIDHNRVDVFTNRLGGGFGLKITRSTLGAVACSIAAFMLNKPVRLVQSMSSVTRALGKRLPCSTDVEVKVSKSGRVQYMTYNLFEDNGHVTSEIISAIGVDVYNNCYKSLWWDYKCYNARTDTAKNSYCRAPASLENIVSAEHIMEQISYELSLDPYDVRMTNLNTLLFGDVKTMGEELKERAEYTERRAAVDKFNAENRWKKRGLRWAFMRYTPLSPAGYEVNMVICHGDGSVVINHGGIELGQGINTKAIQICAHFFNISVDKIKVKGHNTLTAPNSIFTSSSITSQSVGMGVEKCCKELLLRLAPIRILLLNPSWEKLIKQAHFLRVDLRARTFVNDILSPIFFVYGVTLSEVEVDILTGESEIVRVDLYEDVGRSVSPEIDVGQVEGAFIFGLGYWTSEKLVYDKENGELKSDRSWNYHVPQARDIPQDFRVYFREKSYSAAIVLGAKVTGEPATCMAVSVPFAMREAVASARKDAGIATTEWFPIDGPYTTEQLCMSSGTKYEHYKLM
ncbi:uncharacterized protein LOC135078111 [Ostrinia nubilalis]|uniref:uncharacterized protein LOC135078111 n=1 Tax=Ostrinia nubilalis TaxID=29057 RepID=UPI0030826522